MYDVVLARYDVRTVRIDLQKSVDATGFHMRVCSREYSTGTLE